MSEEIRDYDPVSPEGLRTRSDAFVQELASILGKMTPNESIRLARKLRNLSEAYIDEEKFRD